MKLLLALLAVGVLAANSGAGELEHAIAQAEFDQWYENTKNKMMAKQKPKVEAETFRGTIVVETHYGREEREPKVEWVEPLIDGSTSYMEGYSYVTKPIITRELVGYSDGTVKWRKRP